MIFCMFFSFYSKFCIGRTKNEVHICNLHSKTQLLMYDKGNEVLNKKYFISRSWIENNQEARTGGRHQKFWEENINNFILSINEQCWREFNCNLNFCLLWHYLYYFIHIGLLSDILKYYDLV